MTLSDQISAIKTRITLLTGYSVMDRDGGAWTHIFTAVGPELPEDWALRSIVLPYESFDWVLQKEGALRALLPRGLFGHIPYGCNV